MACKIIYKGVSYDESDFKSQIERYVAINNLFNENENLANVVYEALGFNVDSSITIKESFNPDIPEATTYALRIDNKYAGLVAVDNNGTINSSIGQTGVELEPEFRGKGFGKKIYLKIAQELLKQGKTLKSELFGKDNINEDATRVWKSLVRDGYAVDKGGYYEIINTLTPQQKQQALQLYSQYLDTIFPNSKVKDIVYHGTPGEKFDKFSDDFKNSNKGMNVGIWENKQQTFRNKAGVWLATKKWFAKTVFAESQGLYEGEGNTLPVIINVDTIISKDLGKIEEKDLINDAIKTVETVHLPDNSGGMDVSDAVYLITKASNTHILGSKQDIEGFKNFVGNVKDVVTNTGLNMSSDEAKAFNSLVNDGTISIKCE